MSDLRWRLCKLRAEGLIEWMRAAVGVGLPPRRAPAAAAGRMPAPGAAKLDECSQGMVLLSLDGLLGGVCTSASDPNLPANALVGAAAAGPGRASWPARLRGLAGGVPGLPGGRPGACRALVRRAASDQRPPPHPPQVACRAAGVPTDSYGALGGIKSNPIPYPTLLANLSCAGSEASLLDCPHTRLELDAPGCEYLSVQCSVPGQPLVPALQQRFLPGADRWPPWHPSAPAASVRSHSSTPCTCRSSRPALPTPLPPAAGADLSAACPAPCDKQLDGTMPCSTPGPCQALPASCQPGDGSCSYTPAPGGTPCPGGACNAEGVCVPAGGASTPGELSRQRRPPAQGVSDSAACAVAAAAAARPAPPLTVTAPRAAPFLQPALWSLQMWC